MGKVQSVCVAHSETLLRHARETGEGATEWDAWRKYTTAPGMDDVSGTTGFPIHLISWSRYVRVNTARVEGWTKVKMFDSGHWARQQSEVEFEWHGERGMGVKRRRTGVLDAPRDTWKIIYVSISQDGLVFFGVGTTIHFFSSGVDVCSQ